jgi:alanyl-tRNA synthetase
MVFAVCDLMNTAYPELNDTAPQVAKVVDAEEARFAHTLAIGLAKLEEFIEQAIQTQKAHDEVASFAPTSKGWLSGKEAFKLSACLWIS